jgi:hypothetical protein
MVFTVTVKSRRRPPRAEKAGLDLGELTVVSTHAETIRWARSDITALLKLCANTLVADASAIPSYKKRFSVGEPLGAATL